METPAGDTNNLLGGSPSPAAGPTSPAPAQPAHLEPAQDAAPDDFAHGPDDAAHGAIYSVPQYYGLPFSLSTELIPDSDSSSAESTGQSDVDSALGSFVSSTASLRSSIVEGIVENGRRYQSFKEGKYMLPNDEQEQERLDLQHLMFLHMLRGKLYLSPLDETRLTDVLDIGTGTGIWAIDFADMYPNARVVGTDLSAIQPHFVPPNCEFEVHDAEDEWNFSRQFSYIHGRALMSCFTDPAQVVRKAYEALAPGGYFELQDGTFPMQYLTPPPANTALVKWNEYAMEAAELAGRPWTNSHNYKRWMMETGFEDVHEELFNVPTNPWAKGQYMKKLSLIFQTDMMIGLEGISMKLFTKFLKWRPEEVNEFLVSVREDFKNRHIKAYFITTVVWGRKPGPAT